MLRICNVIISLNIIINTHIPLPASIIHPKMDKYKNKYRIPSARAAFWDYGWNAAYFVTICTKNHEYFFGDVINGRMKLSPIGHIANSCWYEIPNHFPFVELGAHVIMPNHVHGIVVINKPVDDSNSNDDSNSDIVETQDFASLQSRQSGDSQQSNKNNPKKKFGPQSKNLASIIRGYKIGVTKNARKVDHSFAWQSRYHDHIIRDEDSYQSIVKYVVNNPRNWTEDKFFEAFPSSPKITEI